MTSKPFSAKHQYLPVCLLRALKVSLFPVSTVFPSFIHVIFGVGFPVAVQWKVTSWFSMIISSAGLVIKLGVSVKEVNRLQFDQ